MIKQIKMEEIYACRLCFDTDVKLFNINRGNIEENIKNLIGYDNSQMDNLPRYLCYLCVNLINKYSSFVKKCNLAQNLFNDYIQGKCKITTKSCKNVHKKVHTAKYMKSETVILDTTVDCDIKQENIECFNSSNYEGDMYIEIEPITEVLPDDNVKIDSCEDKTDGVASDKEGIKRELSSSSEDEEPLSKMKSKIQPLRESFIKVLHLTREEQIKDVEARKLSLNYTRSPYKCSLCFKGYLEQTSFNNHMVRHHEMSGKFVCDICHVRLQSRRQLKSHSVSAHERKFTCTRCDAVCHTSTQAREHEKWHMGHMYKCEKCGVTFRKSTTLLTHIRLHHPSNYICNVCGESFLSELGLNGHKKRMHRDDVKENNINLICGKCDIVFKNNDALKMHEIKDIHDITKACRDCGDNFNTKEELTLHMKSHTESSVQCEQCTAKFSNARKCYAHFTRMHLGINKYRNHNIVCEVCGRKFLSNASLTYHQRTHTGEKPYECNFCPKKFSVRQRLEIHIRTHTGERPFLCTDCPKAFKHKAALNRHLRIHSGEKPYTCRHCGKSFSQSNSVKMHIHTVHLKLPPPYKGKKTETTNS